MSKYSYIYMVLFITMLFTSCFEDKGNYEYKAVNEVIIGDKGFADTIYKMRLDVDRLVISPEIESTFNQTDNYSYEWVAVGQTKYKGQRFVIGTDKNIDYEIKLPAESYKLYLKVSDKNTDLVFSRDVELMVSSLYSTGWMLAGEDENGVGQMDMLSISRDTLLLKKILKPTDGLSLAPINLLWIDNQEYPLDDRLYISSDEGSYKMQREDFSGGESANILYSFTNTEYYTKGIITDLQRINDKRFMAIIDGYAYDISSVNNGLIGNPVNYYGSNYNMFAIGNKYACNHKQVDVRVFSFYNDDAKRFCYISNFGNYLINLTDDSDELYSWNTKEDFPDTGLDFVTTINSYFGSGQSATILKNPQTGKSYIYTYTVNRSSVVSKSGKYEVQNAPGFDSATSFIVSTQQGYMIYASDNKLYGYDFRNGKSAILLKEFDGSVTSLFHDTITDEKTADNFYVATYTDGEANSGKLYKFGIADSPNSISISEVCKWTGLLKINCMYYKSY